VNDAIAINEHQLKVGLFKLALFLTFIVVIFGLAASLVAERFQSIGVNSVLFCLAFFMLSNGILCVLHIIDWFEARKAKSNG
jgi:hypothetical protein